jgi:hypothetical protein
LSDDVYISFFSKQRGVKNKANRIMLQNKIDFIYNSQIEIRNFLMSKFNDISFNTDYTEPDNIILMKQSAK